MPEERKLVSILFADVVGSTTLADSMDVEDVRALMRRYYEHARRIIAPHGGTLEKFIGDAIMAVFGLTQVHENDAERALAAALVLREAIATDEVLSPHMQLRIGVNTGEVMATNDPQSLDFLVTGDAVNVAARLQQGARSGEILASERTMQVARQAFLFAEMRELPVKGKPQPLRAFPLKGVRPVRQVERPPFVGRQRDLLQLEALRKRVLTERSPQLVSLVAAAGTGKSRLLEEFLQRLAPSEGFQVAFAHCPPYGQTLTYWPLRGLLADLLGREPEMEHVRAIFVQQGYEARDAARLADLILSTLGVEDNAESGAARHNGKKEWERSPLPNIAEFLGPLSQPENWSNLEKKLEGLEKLDDFNPLGNIDVNDWLRRAGLEALNDLGNSPNPPDAALLASLKHSVKEKGQELREVINENVSRALREAIPWHYRGSERESIFVAWRLLIEALATQTPRILVFEDLHWASESVLDLVEHILHLQAEVPLLIVVLSRPELLDRRPEWGSERQNMTLLPLQPLDEQLMYELIARRGETVPEEVRQQIAMRSGGNPFFALELLHAFSELQAKGDAHSFRFLPDTVHAAVLARIDLLGQRERSVLQAASVPGRAFPRALLRAVLDEQTNAEIEGAVEGLLTRELLVQVGDDSYDFQHILIRDVAYGTLARGERIRMHSKIACWMEEMAGGNLESSVALIAYHYHEAYQLSRQSAVPLELPFKRGDAALVFARAARLARRSGSFAEVNSNFLLAIELSSAREQARLHEERGDSVSWSGSVPYEAYSAALASWRACGASEPAMGARLIRKVLNAASRILFFSALQPEETAALRAEGLALAQQARAVDEQWRLRVNACFDPRYLLARSRKAHRAELLTLKENALKAADYFEQQQNWVALSEALDGGAGVAIYLHDLQEALALSQRRLAIPDLPAEEWVDAIFVIEVIYFWLGDYNNSIVIAQTVLDQLKPGQPVASLGKLTNGLAVAYLTVGQWDELIKLVPRLDEIQELVQYDRYAAANLSEGYRAVLLVALARQDQALIERSSELLQKYAGLQSPASQDFLAALLADTPAKIAFAGEVLSDRMMSALLCFYNEHGEPLPDVFLRQIEESEVLASSTACFLQISQALRNQDQAELARTIDAAEARGLLPHAARMRIILSQRSGDPAPLVQARPVLERLGDRQFLRRLEEVASLKEE